MADTDRKVFDPALEGNPAPIVNPDGNLMRCIGGCGDETSAADGLCITCWMHRHDARLEDQ